jgi:hypothetical protein
LNEREIRVDPELDGSDRYRNISGREERAENKLERKYCGEKEEVGNFVHLPVYNGNSVIRSSERMRVRESPGYSRDWERGNITILLSRKFL